MSVSEQDFMSIQEAAKKLNVSMDQVMFLIEDGRLTGYFQGVDAFNLMARFTGGTKLFKYAKIKAPITWSRHLVKFSKAIYYDENFNPVIITNEPYFTGFGNNCIRPYPTESIMLFAKEVDIYNQREKEAIPALVKLGMKFAESAGRREDEFTRYLVTLFQNYYESYRRYPRNKEAMELLESKLGQGFIHAIDDEEIEWGKSGTTKLSTMKNRFTATRKRLKKSR